MAGYSSRVNADIERWAAAGLIDAATAAALRRDVEAHARRSFSFGTVLAMMAALLFGAALLIFVAANWQAVPRLARLAGLFAVILAGYVGGALAKNRGHATFGEALWIVAAAAFGGGIALVGQMYHLAGSESSAVLTWGAGTALAAAALRSGPLTVAAAGIADGWLAMNLSGGFRLFGRSEFPHPFVAIAIVLYALSFWTRSAPARHLLLLSLIAYAALYALDRDLPQLSMALAAVSAVAFAAAMLAPAAVEGIFRLDGRLPLHALIGFLAGAACVQSAFVDGAGATPGFVVASAVALAGIVAAVVLAGRESAGLRWVAYLGFAFELVVIYLVTMQTMLDTATFFLAAATVVALLAFAIVRIERRWAAPASGGA